MKKLVVLGTICAVFGASVAFAATKVQEIKAWDFFAQMQTIKGDSVLIYKVDDKNNECYISVMYFGMTGASHSMSCVAKVK